LARRAIFKGIIGPMRYGRSAGYDARRYWQDRLGKYGPSLRGAGHEGLSESDNAQMNADAADTLLKELDRAGLDLPQCEVLDVGPGSGFAARLLHRAGVRSYVGLDITDTLFDRLQSEFPSYQFRRADISEQHVTGYFDLVLMLDVLEHIVDEGRLSDALANARLALKAGGILAVSLPMAEGSPRSLFYLRLWDFKDICGRLSGLILSTPVQWRDGQLILARLTDAVDA
jgi:2-polyprenyl-3-methyl-5-hydroxy-6-metoxy-1,4-benzoquinol methylase